MAIKLTQQYVNNCLNAPPGMGHIEITDKDTTGLYIDVAATSPGVGTYYFRKRINGLLRRFPLGSTAQISLAEARDKALVKRKEIADGKVAAVTKKEAKAKALTLDLFFSDHYMPYAKPRKRSFAKDEQLFRLRIQPRFGAQLLGSIKRQQIEKFLVELKEEGLSGSSADHHVKLLRRMLNLAVEWEMLDKNPAARIELLNEDNRLDHSLGPAELARLFAVLKEDETCVVSKVALFLFATSARLQEALKAKWSDIDRINRVWKLPAIQNKSKRLRTIPLSDFAMEVLDSLGTEGQSDFLFVSSRTKEPIRYVHKRWEVLREKAGMPHLRLHDARHTGASLMASQGVSLYQIQTILGHTDPKTSMRYSAVAGSALVAASNTAGDIYKVAMQKGV